MIKQEEITGEFSRAFGGFTLESSIRDLDSDTARSEFVDQMHNAVRAVTSLPADGYSLLFQDPATKVLHDLDTDESELFFNLMEGKSVYNATFFVRPDLAPWGRDLMALVHDLSPTIRKSFVNDIVKFVNDSGDSELEKLGDELHRLTTEDHIDNAYFQVALCSCAPIFASWSAATRIRFRAFAAS